MEPPEIRYARSGNTSIAYQVLGAGAPDLLHIRPFVSSLHTDWEQRLIVRFYRALASFSRLILFDKRGTGLSDRSVEFPTLETRMDDIRIVMDAAGSERAALLGRHDGCHLAALFAATYPERASALIVYEPAARFVSAPDYRWGMSPEEAQDLLSDIGRGWGTQELAGRLMPSHAPDEMKEWYITASRVAASPAAALAFYRAALSTDVRDVLPAIRVPTLVLHGRAKREEALDFARRIPDAVAVELQGDHGMMVREDIAGEVEDFLAGRRLEPIPDRVLATILFTDVVGSGDRTALLGDRRWRDVIEAHHRALRREIARFRGSEVDTAGDGFFATFDGPARAIACARAAVAAAREVGLEIRAGVHTGECEVIDDKVGGIAVVTGARVASLASAGEVLVSHTVKDLVAGSGLEFEDRGVRELKGVPGEWRLYSVVDA